MVCEPVGEDRLPTANCKLPLLVDGALVGAHVDGGAICPRDGGYVRVLLGRAGVDLRVERNVQCWFLRAEALQPVPQGGDQLALVALHVNLDEGGRVSGDAPSLRISNERCSL